MGELALWGLFWLLIALALVGCFINKVPGPVLALVAVLIAKLCMVVGELIAWWNVILIGLIVIASWWITKQLPKWISGLGTYGKSAKWGSIIGSIAALIIVPAIVSGIENNGVAFTVILVTGILMTFIFAVGLEFLSVKDIKVSVKSGGIAAFEYTCATLIKLIAVIYAVYLVLTNN